MSVSGEDLRSAYLLGKSSNRELTADVLQKKGWSVDRVLRVFNALVERRLCAYHKDKVTGKVRVKVREEEVACAVRPLSADDYAVYCAIEDAGQTGIWTQDICRVTGLQSHVVQKAVKSLYEQKKLIKPLKSIHQKNRKIYILAYLQPAKEVVGGTFYNNAEFNETLVERLRDQIIYILKNGTQATFQDISSYVRSCGFGSELSDADLTLVLNTLQLEQSIHVSVSSVTGEVLYSWSRWIPHDTWFSSIPCFRCPVAHECIRDAGLKVSPNTCRYYDMWLECDIEEAGMRTLGDPECNSRVGHSSQKDPQ